MFSCVWFFLRGACTKCCGNHSSGCGDISLWKKVVLEEVLEEKVVLEENQGDSACGDYEYECLYKISWQSIQQFLRYFSLDQSRERTIDILIQLLFKKCFSFANYGLFLSEKGFCGKTSKVSFWYQYRNCPSSFFSYRWFFFFFLWVSMWFFIYSTVELPGIAVYLKRVKFTRY